MEQFDIEKQTKELQSSTLKAIKGLFPIKTKTGTLRLSNIWADDRLDPGDIKSQLKAKNSDRTWGVPVYGTFELLDEDGKVVQKKDKIRLVTLPKPTPRMSYIINGSEHQISNQLRLRPAGYTVRTGPGGIKGQINLSKGYSGQIELHMKPETGVMRTKIGQANQRLYPILNALGLSDSEISRRWGQDVLEANKDISKSDYDSAVKSFAKSLLKKDYADVENASRDLRKFVLETEMDPKINQRTLGKPHKAMSAEFLADLGSHVLESVKGEKEPHDRNALEYKEYRKITDLIEERLALPEFRNKITRKIQYNIAGKDKIEDMIHPAIIGPDIKAVFNLPELHQRPDQLNPIDMWNTATRVTIMGPGGIQSEHQVTDDMRDVHPSHLGYLDPVHTPEGESVGYVYHLPFTVTSKGKTLLTRAINTKTNKLERIDPATFSDSVVAFPGQYDRKNKKWKDPKKVVVLAEGNKTKTVLAKDVDYTLESPKQGFSMSSNLIPFLETNSGGRTLVASKMAEQAVPLKEREKPLVQSRVGGNVTFDNLIGDAFVFRSPVDGVVSKVSEDSISIRGKDGKLNKVQMYNNFPLNSKSFISSDSKVKKGDIVSKDQIISDTNFTQDGSMALGKNLVTAYMPYKGYNFEDGIVITDTAAKKLTSEHMYLETAQQSDRFDIHKRRFVAHYPNVYSKTQIDTIDDDGVVKKGTIVQPGDPVITRLRKDEIDPENLVLGKLSRTLVRPWKDDSISWHGDMPGKVTDIVRHGNKVKVYIKTEEPATIGDKLVGRYGNKGVVGCFSSDFEILTDDGWVFFKDLSESSKVCTLNQESNKIEYHKPVRIINEIYKGKMLHYSCRRMEMCCTPNHRHWVRTNRVKEYRFKTSEEIHTCGSIHRRGGVEWDAEDVDMFTVPGKNVFPDQHKEFGQSKSYKMDDFLEFFGYWISEGCLGRRSGIHIAQKKSSHPEVYQSISDCLERLGYKVSKEETKQTIYDPRLLSWLWQFGKSKEKFIPKEFLNLSKRQLGILFDSMMDGDGGTYYDERYKHTRLEYFTISKRLADDVQEIALKLGISANIKPQIRKDKKNTEYVVRLTFKNEVWMNVDKRTAKTEWIDYSGTIHCVEVKNNIIYVRKNGIPVFSGNSIIPENEAPRTKDGTPADILLNPHGIITRINIGQVLENAASKVAEKTGKTYVTDNFSDKNSTQEVKDALAKNNLSDLEELEDPVTGKSLGKVNVGKTYIMKLKKQVRSQFSARGAGPGWRYSQHTQEPVKGGEEGSKSMDLLTFYSMLGHGSRANLREMASIKGTRNDEFWDALKTGSLLPAPKPTFAYNKFLAYMKGAGVDVKQEGSKLTLAPMTDKEIDNLSNGAISDPQFVRAKDLEEKPGGLMDKKVTGGLRGEKWSHIQLNEPIVNPIFEQPVRSLLDMNKSTYNGITEGRIFVDEEGNYNEEENGLTGGKAIKKLLSQVDKDKKLKEFTEAAKNARSPSTMNKANHGIRYVEALKRFNLNPQDAYILNKVPVLPPIFRPIYSLPDGNLHTSSVNYLYRDLGLANQKLKFMNSLEYMPESAKQELRRDIYKGTAAVQGLANPITFYPKNRPVRGIIEEIKGVKGAGSKTGFFQKHVLRREQDLVGRGTVIPEPKLGIDEVGLPEEMAWTIFRPFVIRELVNQGYRAVDADKQVDDRSFIAKKALDTAMNDRPVLLNRAPSLHKFSIMAFKPKISAGRAIKIPPLVVKGFNADHDGDTMHVHVPVLPKAVTEAQGMVPSKHLFNPGTGNIMVAPSQEASIGLYFLTRDGKDIKKSFAAVGPLKDALDKKEIDISDMVTLAGRKTSAGRAMVDAVLPKKYQGRNQVLDKKGVSALLTEIAQNDPQDYAKTVHALAELGNEYAYNRGFTVSISDVQPDLPEKDALFAEARKKAQSLDDEGIVKLYSDVDKKAKKIIAKRLGEQGNNLYQMVRSGARGNMDQLKQIVSAPLLFEDVHGDPLPIPVDNSFSKGLSMSEYWNGMYGARKGSVDMKLQTAKPGEFNKDLMATAVKNVIAEEDCGTDRGVDFSIDDREAQDRVLTSDIKVGTKTVAKAGDVITSNIISKLRLGNVKKIKARSPLTCNLPKGTCAKCYGLDTDGRLHAVGDNIGAIAGQSLTEPLTQMVLRSRHSGGVAGGQQLTGYDKIDKLVHMPKIIVGKATLAERTGKITNVEDSPAGGKNVYIDDVKHFIAPGNSLKTRTGLKVQKGDPLSDGIIHPRDLVRLKGMESAQNYLVDELSNAYKDTGVNLKRKNIEAVIRSVADTTRVLDGGDSEWLYGDTVSYNAAEAFNRSALGKIPLMEAQGKPLYKDHGPVKAGTKVGKRVSKILEGLGYNEVSVGPDPIVHEPFLDGIKQLPMLNKDWMAQMGYGHLVRGIKEGAGEAWTTDIHDYSPVPAFAYGAEFGLGEKGRY